MYRALTWLARRDGVDPADGAALADLAVAHPVSFADGGHVEVDGEDVTAAIREAEIDRLVPRSRGILRSGRSCASDSVRSAVMATR